MGQRKNAPVFVMGSPRSGTTYFYHILLSSGDFAVYRAEARVFDMLAPHFGDLSVRRNRENLLQQWLSSEFFHRTGLDPEMIREKILADCKSSGDFLRIFMERIAQQQNVRRWAECTPNNVHYMQEIKRSIPDALFLHLIRDGRDVALSVERQGWIRPLPWDRDRRLLVIGLFWEWIARSGRENGRKFPGDYMEVPYEELVEKPHECLAKVASFIEHDLDYDRILQAGIGSVSEPNTSFGAEAKKGSFQPVGRWKAGIAQEALAELEAVIGPALTEFGYSLATTNEQRRNVSSRPFLRGVYRLLFGTKHCLKSYTPLGRLVNIDLLRDFHAYDQDRLLAKRASR